MSDTVLQIIFKVAGVPTSVTSMLLSDPTGTYGAKRTDTNAILVADGAAMTQASTGVYRYTLTAAEGLPVSWWAEATYNGTVYRFEREVTTSTSSPAGQYPTLDGMIAIDGLKNLQAYSSVDGEDPGTLNTTRVQLAMNSADAIINQYLDTNGVAFPVTASDPYFTLLKDAGALYANVWLYGSRGGRDTLNPLTNEFDPRLSKANDWRNRADKLLARFVLAKRRNISTSVSFAGNTRNGWQYPCG